jgi:hypothetical protein
LEILEKLFLKKKNPKSLENRKDSKNLKSFKNLFLKNVEF